MCRGNNRLFSDKRRFNMFIKLAVESANKKEVTDTYQFQDINERNLTKVKYRWTFHVVVNLNMITSVLLCLYSIILLFFGVYSYEYSVTANNLFYNNKTSKYSLKNYSFMSNGKIYILCQVRLLIIANKIKI